MLWLLLLSLLQGLTASKVWTGYIIINTKKKEDLLNFSYKPDGNPSDLVRIFYFISYSYTSYTLDFLFPGSEPADSPYGGGILRPSELGCRHWAGPGLQYPGVLQTVLCRHSPARLQHQQFLDEIFPFRAAATS